MVKLTAERDQILSLVSNYAWSNRVVSDHTTDQKPF